jgi:arabinofuranosyltransferase
MKRVSTRDFIFVLAALAITVVGFWQYHRFFHDDAYISLRYAHNFLHGDGLVWNPGERVEGYSNFLLVILVSGLGKLGVDLVPATRVIGVASFALLALFVAIGSFRWRRGDETDHALWLLPTIFTVTSLPLIIWSMGGLETVLFTLLCTIGFWQFAESLDGNSRRSTIAGFALGLASVTHPEGGLFFGIAFLFGVCLKLRGKTGSSRWLVSATGAFLAVLVPLIIFRLSYYGDFVPNTWYVKGSFAFEKLIRGFTYLSEYFLAWPLMLPAAVFLLAWRGVGRALERKTIYLAVTILLYLLYVAMVGGDHMPAFRFLVPIIPVTGFLIYLCLRSLAERWSPRFRSLTVPIMLVLCGLQIPFPAEATSRAQITDGAAFLGKVVGEYIATNWPRGSLIALNTAGSTPYYAPNDRFIDMLGLNDKTIARRKDVPMLAAYQWVPGHEKGDGAYVLSRRPDFIICGGSNGDFVKNRWFLTELELLGLPEFARDYRIDEVMLPTSQIPGFEDYRESRKGQMSFLFYRRVAK